MYSNQIKSLYEREIARQAALGGMWGGIAFGAIALVAFALGAFEGGVVEENPAGACATGYLLGALLGWVSRWGAYQDQSFDERERALEALSLRFGDDVVGIARESMRLKAAARKWNAFAWPVVLLRRLALALTPVPGRAGT